MGLLDYPAMPLRDVCMWRSFVYISAIYAPMIYKAPCIMILMRAASITWASGRGLGPENLDFLGPQMALAYQLDAISQCPENVKDAAHIKSVILYKSDGWFQGPYHPSSAVK
jgi:hypothetical protein